MCGWHFVERAVWLMGERDYSALDSASPLASLGAALCASRFALQTCRTRLVYVRGFESRRGSRERTTTCYVEGLAVNFGGERGSNSDAQAVDLLENVVWKIFPYQHDPMSHLGSGAENPFCILPTAAERRAP